jgi:type I restriction-modification system DNA methylase subunit
MFEQAFKNIDDVLWKEAGCTTELDYTEQTSWLLFLKYLDDLEQDKATEAALDGKKYTYILDKPYRWETWAAPKDKDGKLDHNKALTGDDLRDFVNAKLFPYLHGFKEKASGPNTLEYKIGEIFGEIKNKIQSGYNLREIIDQIDELRFRSQKEKHELSHLYEAKIRNMGNAGRNGGEYYTPRPLIRAIIRVVQPKIGDKIYDGAVGSAGFLCESYEYLACPGGTFLGAGVKTVVLFFEKGAPTRKIWYYQLDPGRSLGKTNPLNDDDLAEFVKLQKTFADSPKSWTVNVKDVDEENFDLSVKNPNGGEEVKHRSPKAIMDEIAALDADSAEVLANIKILL